MPRAKPNEACVINYQHIIDSLVRKPSAFANYQYRDYLFPRPCFRQAYDKLKSARSDFRADQIYLKLLYLAKLESESLVAMALELLLETDQMPSEDAVRQLITDYRKETKTVAILQPDLSQYDGLLQHPLSGEAEQ